MSRATTLDGLFLIGKFKKTKPDPSTVAGQTRPTNNVQRQKIYPQQEMSRLRNEALLHPKFETLHNVPNNCIQLVSHNVQSLKPHINSIRQDTIFIKSKLLLLQETWVKTIDDENTISIPNKRIILKNSLVGNMAKGKGTIIYGCDKEHILSVACFDRHHNCPIDITIAKWKDVFIINMYQSSQTTNSELTTALNKLNDYLNQPNVILSGDFNENLFDNSCRISNKLKTYGLSLLSPRKSTTIRKTIIDGVFGHLDNYTCDVKVYESYFSDHKPLVIRLHPKEVQSTGLSQPLQILNMTYD